MNTNEPSPWPLIREAFDRTLQCPASERRAFVIDNYPTDVVVQVTSLLEHHSAATNFLAPAPAEVMREEFEDAFHEPFQPVDVTGRTLAGRYAIGTLIGQGGTASVYEALDQISGDVVAVKVAAADTAPHRDLIVHEAAALRLLRLPGIVDLLDMGTDDNVSFLVMNRIRGVPFPGPNRAGKHAWPSIQHAALSLLEALARIHWTGLAHCDLKPNNVLVNLEGNAIILDLGIAQDPGSEDDLRRYLARAGTPRYTAPEQLLGKAGTAASDLYAVGVMLYEALAGRDPHDACNATEIVCFRPNVPPPPLREVAPEVPVAIATLVDRLIEASPADRPASAAEVAAALRAAIGGGPPLPALLGSRQVIDAVLSAAREGTSIDISGEPGSGRSSILREAKATLIEEGRQVVTIQASQKPLGSLDDLLGPPFEVRAETGVDIEEQVLGALRDALRAGTILVVDDAEGIDDSSARALEASRDGGAIVRAFTEAREGALAVPALTRTDLAALFDGHERIHHIPSDAADELYRRTAGRPGDVHRELAAWERAGLARWEGPQVVIQRADLERLRGGLRVRAGETHRTTPLDRALMDVLVCIDLLGAHATVERCAQVLDEATGSIEGSIEARVGELARSGEIILGPGARLRVASPTPGGAHWPVGERAPLHGRLAEAIPPHEPLRLYHRLMSDNPAPLAKESLQVAEALLAESKATQACALLLDSVGALRRAGTPLDETPHLELLLRASLGSGTLVALDRLIYALDRSADEATKTGPIAKIARAAHLALQRDTARALASLPPHHESMSDEVRRGAASTRFFLARQLDPSEARTLIEESAAEARPSDGAWHHNAITRARAWLAYAEDDYVTAGELHDEVTRTSDAPLSRLSSLLNAASAWLEAGDHARAEAIAKQARTMARESRHVHYEARAERILRAAAYRGGAELDVDTELTEAMEALGVPHLEALTCLNEAAIAWRTGRRLLAQTLAGRAEAIWRRAGNPWPMLLAQALGIAAGQPTPADVIEGLATRLGECPQPTIGVQAAYLASIAPSAARDELKALAQTHAEDVPRARWEPRLEITSIREAVH